MYKFVYNRLKQSSYKGKLIDKEKSEEVFVNLKINYNIIGRALDFFVNDDSKITFCFQPDHHRICINYKKFFENYVGEDAYIVNLEYLFLYVHEMEHVRQYKFYQKSNYDDITDPLIKLEYFLDSCSFDYMFLTGKNPKDYTDKDLKIIKDLGYENDDNIIDKLIERYNNKHNLLFIERLANIRSAQFVYNFIDCNDKTVFEKKKVLSLYKSAIDRFLLENSENYIDNFINTFGMKHRADEIYNLINQINDTYKLDDETRVMYGLDVNRDTLKSYFESYINSYFYFKEEDKKMNFWRFRRIKSKTK